MDFRKTSDRYYVYVRKNEPILETLTQFCQDQKIDNGQIFGIGAVKNVELGAFDPETREYTRKMFAGAYELITCQANITLLEGAPFIHAHVSISDHHFQVHAGHLFSGEVAVVGEFIVIPVDGEVERKVDPDIGLATWNL